MRLISQLVLLVGVLIGCCWCCDHPIFCEGPVLKAVQLSGLFNDSKTFVDMPLRYDVDVVLQNFKKQPIEQFVRENFLDPETIIKPADLPDWKAQPVMFNYIQDPKLKQFAYAINLKWKGLAKRFSLSQLANVSSCKANCTSILEVTNEKIFIAPGGRFHECYYWDTYWIVKGLISSDMLDTAEAVIRGFFDVVNTYGFVPNGMRIYYLSRSQPPLLALMVEELAYEYRMRFQSLKAVKLEQDAIPVLVKQHTYWMQTHSRNVTVKGRVHTVNFYNANTTDPRPQSYKEDYMLTVNMSQSQRAVLLKNIASAAQSGWDFSSRWFADARSLNTTRTTEINPTDLNAFMGMAELAIAQMALAQGNNTIYGEYTKYASNRKIYFNSIEQQGFYPDYPEQREFYASWLMPLIFMNKDNTYKFQELVSPPTSFLNSGQQWDYPNVWAPLVWALLQSSPQDQKLSIAQKWIDTVYCGWRKYGVMYEKYHAEKIGQRGEGGQYVVQEGFGWTNGVTLDILLSYGSELTARNC